MKRLILILFFGFFILQSAVAQVKIGDNPQNINPTSVLELESANKVLVITRMTTSQMNAITPLQGAIVYNTDLQNVHYFNGTQWVNIGAGGTATDGQHTAQSLANPGGTPTIVITPTANGDNFEVAENSIGTLQITNGGVNGMEDIQDNSINSEKLQDESVTQDKLSENSVGLFQIDNDNLPVSAFANDLGYITSANIVSADANNALQIGTDNGVFYDESPLITAIQNNTDAIALDNDTSPGNEIQNLTLDNATNILSISGSASTVDLSTYAGGIGSDDQNLTLTGNVLEIEDGNTIDLTPILGGSSNQNLSQVLTEGNDGGALLIKNISNPTDAQDAATKAYVDAQITSGGTLADGTILIGNTAGTAQQLSISGDATMANTGALTIAPDAITLDKIHQNGATADGDIMQWNNTNGEWEVGSSLKGKPKNLFFADPNGNPTDTDAYGISTDNGGLFWDYTKRVNTGALYVGLKQNGNSFGQSVVGDHAKLVVAEAIDDDIAFPLQIINEDDTSGVGTGVGILFSNSITGSPGGAALIYERIGTQGQGDFHFLSSTTGETIKPSYTDKAFTITKDKDIRLYGDLFDKNDNAANPTPVGYVLTNTSNGTEWAALPNLGAGNITQDAETRTYNLNNQNLIFNSTGTDGKIGVGDFGQTGPASIRSEFDVDGQITASNGFAASAGSAGNPGYGFYTSGDTNMGMFRAGVDRLAFSTNGAEALEIDAAGNVGIGDLSNAIAEKLHVYGNIRAESNFISANTTIQIPDYVFQNYFLGNSELKENYDFKTLDKIEAFVKKHHHLPGIKSAAQVKKEGVWNLSASNLQNLEKIEELFLHTIEQEHKIKRLQTEKEALSAELKAIKKDIKEIKTLLKK